MLREEIVEVKEIVRQMIKEEALKPEPVKEEISVLNTTFREGKYPGFVAAYPSPEPFKEAATEKATEQEVKRNDDL